MGMRLKIPAPVIMRNTCIKSDMYKNKNKNENENKNKNENEKENEGLS